MITEHRESGLMRHARQQRFSARRSRLSGVAVVAGGDRRLSTLEKAPDAPRLSSVRRQKDSQKMSDDSDIWVTSSLTPDSTVGENSPHTSLLRVRSRNVQSRDLNVGGSAVSDGGSKIAPMLVPPRMAAVIARSASPTDDGREEASHECPAERYDRSPGEEDKENRDNSRGMDAIVSCDLSVVDVRPFRRRFLTAAMRALGQQSWSPSRSLLFGVDADTMDSVGAKMGFLQDERLGVDEDGGHGITEKKQEQKWRQAERIEPSSTSNSIAMGRQQLVTGERNAVAAKKNTSPSSSSPVPAPTTRSAVASIGRNGYCTDFTTKCEIISGDGVVSPSEVCMARIGNESSSESILARRVSQNSYPPKSPVRMDEGDATTYGWLPSDLNGVKHLSEMDQICLGENNSVAHVDFVEKTKKDRDKSQIQGFGFMQTAAMRPSVLLPDARICYGCPSASSRCLCEISHNKSIRTDSKERLSFSSYRCHVGLEQDKEKHLSEEAGETSWIVEARSVGGYASSSSSPVPISQTQTASETPVESESPKPRQRLSPANDRDHSDKRQCRLRIYQDESTMDRWRWPENTERLDPSSLSEATIRVVGGHAGEGGYSLPMGAHEEQENGHVASPSLTFAPSSPPPEHLLSSRAESIRNDARKAILHCGSVSNRVRSLSSCVCSHVSHENLESQSSVDAGRACSTQVSERINAETLVHDGDLWHDLHSRWSPGTSKTKVTGFNYGADRANVRPFVQAQMSSVTASTSDARKRRYEDSEDQEATATQPVPARGIDKGQKSECRDLAIVQYDQSQKEDTVDNTGSELVVPLSLEPCLPLADQAATKGTDVATPGARVTEANETFVTENALDADVSLSRENVDGRDLALSDHSKPCSDVEERQLGESGQRSDSRHEASLSAMASYISRRSSDEQSTWNSIQSKQKTIRRAPSPQYELRPWLKEIKNCVFVDSEKSKKLPSDKSPHENTPSTSLPSYVTGQSSREGLESESRKVRRWRMSETSERNDMLGEERNGAAGVETSETGLSSEDGKCDNFLQRISSRGFMSPCSSRRSSLLLFASEGNDGERGTRWSCPSRPSSDATRLESSELDVEVAEQRKRDDFVIMEPLTSEDLSNDQPFSERTYRTGMTSHIHMRSLPVGWTQIRERRKREARCVSFPQLSNLEVCDVGDRTNEHGKDWSSDSTETLSLMEGKSNSHQENVCPSAMSSYISRMSSEVRSNWERRRECGHAKITNFGLSSPLHSDTTTTQKIGPENEGLKDPRTEVTIETAQETSIFSTSGVKDDKTIPELRLRSSVASEISKRAIDALSAWELERRKRETQEQSP